MLDHGPPVVTVAVGLELTRAHLALGDATAARRCSARPTVLELRPDLGTLVDEARELRERVAASSEPAGAWAMSLTGAELRLLPYLATHLTFPEIATRLFISRNTAKTEAVAIYRKFGVASRGQAIERAVEVGLLDSTVFPPQRQMALMDDAPSGRSRCDVRHHMDEYKQRLRQLAVHDDALLESIAVEGGLPGRRSST